MVVLWNTVRSAVLVFCKMAHDLSALAFKLQRQLRCVDKALVTADKQYADLTEKIGRQSTDLDTSLMLGWSSTVDVSMEIVKLQAAEMFLTTVRNKMPENRPDIQCASYLSPDMCCRMRDRVFLLSVGPYGEISNTPDDVEIPYVIRWEVCDSSDPRRMTPLASMLHITQNVSRDSISEKLVQVQTLLSSKQSELVCGLRTAYNNARVIPDKTPLMQKSDEVKLQISELKAQRLDLAAQLEDVMCQIDAMDVVETLRTQNPLFDDDSA